MKQLQLKEVEKTVESIPMGQKAYFSKTVTEGDVALFAGITGAFEPLSMNQEFAEKTPYLSRHGPDHAVGHLHMACFHSDRLPGRGDHRPGVHILKACENRRYHHGGGRGDAEDNGKENSDRAYHLLQSGRRDGDGWFCCGIDAGALGGGMKKWL